MTGGKKKEVSNYRSDGVGRREGRGDVQGLLRKGKNNLYLTEEYESLNRQNLRREQRGAKKDNTASLGGPQTHWGKDIVFSFRYHESDTLSEHILDGDL